MGCDNRLWRVLQVRNPWGANPAAEWKGTLCDNWPQWNQFPELKQALEIGNAELDGMVQNSTSQKHDKKFKSSGGGDAQPAPQPIQQPQVLQQPQYVQPSRTVYAGAQTYAAPATYAAPVSYAAPMTYAAPTQSVIRYA